MDFASRISVLCFGASYAICFAAELARFAWPGRVVRWVATAAAVAGLAAQTLFLAHRGATEGRVPIVNHFDSLIFVSWLSALMYLYLLLRDRRFSAGPFLLPVTLGLIGFASTLTDRDARRTDLAANVLGTAHGLLQLVGALSVLIAAVFATMYLVKLRQLRHGTAVGRVRLPSLERLDRLHSLALYVAWPTLTTGVGLGFLMGGLSLVDPKVVSTVVAWGILTVLAHYRQRPEHRGRRVALFTLAAGLAVLVSLLGDSIFPTAHQKSSTQEARS